MARLMQKYILNSGDDALFESFFDVVRTSLSAREILLLVLGLFLQRICFKKGRLPPKEGSSDRFKNLNEFVEYLKDEKSRFKSFQSFERTLNRLKSNRDFWTLSWKHGALRRRTSKDTFKVFLPKLVDRIVAQRKPGAFEEFLHERKRGLF